MSFFYFHFGSLLESRCLECWRSMLPKERDMYTVPKHLASIPVFHWNAYCNCLNLCAVLLSVSVFLFFFCFMFVFVFVFVLFLFGYLHFLHIIVLHSVSTFCMKIVYINRSGIVFLFGRPWYVFTDITVLIVIWLTTLFKYCNNT